MRITRWIRIWGGGLPRYWYHFDPHRPNKTSMIVLEPRHGFWHPVLTPKDPERALEVLTDRLDALTHDP